MKDKFTMTDEEMKGFDALVAKGNTIADMVLSVAKANMRGDDTLTFELEYPDSLWYAPAGTNRGSISQDAVDDVFTKSSTMTKNRPYIMETFDRGDVSGKGTLVSTLPGTQPPTFRLPAQINLMHKTLTSSTETSTAWCIVISRNDVDYFLCDVDEETGQRTWSKNIDDSAYLFLNEGIARKVWESLGKIGELVEIPVSK